MGMRDLLLVEDTFIETPGRMSIPGDKDHSSNAASNRRVLGFGVTAPYLDTSRLFYSHPLFQRSSFSLYASDWLPSFHPLAPSHNCHGTCHLYIVPLIYLHLYNRLL